MVRSKVISKVQKAMSPFKADSKIILFGSQARGDAKKTSDVDLLIIVNKENLSYEDECRISAPLYDIELETGVPINPIIIPSTKWGNRITPFYENVTKDGITL